MNAPITQHERIGLEPKHLGAVGRDQYLVIVGHPGSVPVLRVVNGQGEPVALPDKVTPDEMVMRHARDFMAWLDDGAATSYAPVGTFCGLYQILMTATWDQIKHLREVVCNG